ncbi:MAG: hemerythrin domain-containing protein [Candidatus Omnitrophica bacterium]|nr:hemerythrin domain-containing protein [Candidatus Omnitrophota bacterium]
MTDKPSHANDPIFRNAEKEISDGGLSPMDPPDAYAPPGKVDVNPELMHPFLKELMADHVTIKEALSGFEKTILTMKQSGVSRESNQQLAHFFHVFDEVFIPHDRREEKSLFPLLEKKLVENGERSKGLIPTTAVDVMEDDHIKAIQLAAVAFNFFGLASRLKDVESRNVVLDAAVTQSEELIELLRLHIFREDSIVFPLAHKHINEADLSRLQTQGVSC